MNGYLKPSATVHNLFCRTARVLAGSVGLCGKLAREDARGPAEEFEWGKGRSQRNRHQRVMKLNEFERRACVVHCLEIETSLAKLSLTSLRRSSA